MTAEELRGLRPPFVVFWELNHFLVVEGFGRDRVYLNDPASGRRSVNLDEFRGLLHRDRLPVRAGAGFPKGGTRPSTWRAIARRMAGAYPRRGVRRPGRAWP